MKQQRRERYDFVASELRSIPDADLSARMAGVDQLGSGIGGVHMMIDIGGVPVFVKKVPLTDIERHSAHTESTRDLFEMPLGCQYGIGSPGFGVWREVAANRSATNLLMEGDLECFAAMYHWRVMAGPASAGPLADELADLDVFVDYWHGSAGVRRRVEAISSASAHVALFLEYIPTTVPQWLKDSVDRGPESASIAIDLVEHSLVRDIRLFGYEVG